MFSGETRVGAPQAVDEAVPGESREQRRRRQLVDAAVGLFVQRGYHETTTRDIAQAAGWSVGELYEFVKSKGDILFHVSQDIHEDTERLLESGAADAWPAGEALRQVIDTYIRACDARQDVILLIYQESNCLSPELRATVMRSEERITASFYHLIQRGVNEGAFSSPSESEAWLTAHNIIVLGQMWAFRRWYMQKHFTLDEYIQVQTAKVMRDLTPR